MFYNLLRDKELEGKAFSDVDPALWYGEPIGAMAALGVIGGYEDGTFRPEQPITRAEFVKMAVACDTLSAGEASFTDVPRLLGRGLHRHGGGRRVDRRLRRQRL